MRPVIHVLVGVHALTQEKSTPLRVWLELCGESHVGLVAGLDKPGVVDEAELFEAEGDVFLCVTVSGMQVIFPAVSEIACIMRLLS